MTPNPHANPIPNILTGLRLVAGVIMFLILAGAAPQGIPFMSDYLSPDDQFRFGRTAFIIYIVAASTDWVDGFLARRWHSTTRWGAILDPIADKVLITGAILGVLAWGALPQIAIPCGLIMFREFAVSALRETVAGKVKLPVTLLAKWKTVLQIVALGALQLVLLWDGFGLPLEWQPQPAPTTSRVSGAS
jgi:CDP-diacylglycerol--glycerol-3-phosphate 3-phosphatidyltransferase